MVNLIEYWLTIISHHGNLFRSLKMLFEDRLGYEVYRPIGIDWFTNGYFKVAEPYGNAQDTIDQYLSTDQKEYDPFKSLNGDYNKMDDVFHIYDPENDITHKAITFETFKKMEFDLIVASHPLHECWEGLLQYQPKAKFIMQLGNDGQITSARNVLSSVWSFSPQPHQRVCYYHQEFPPLPICPNPNENKITSFVHLLPHPELFEQYRSLLPEFDFMAYGMSTRGGVPSKQQMLSEMIKSTFGWHIKPADGYGHLLHQWFAMGIPVITRASYYQGKTGGMLLVDNETCIDLDSGNPRSNVERIRFWSDPTNNEKMRKNVRDIFSKVCNFEEEANNIKTFLSNIF